MKIPADLLLVALLLLLVACDKRAESARNDPLSDSERFWRPVLEPFGNDFRDLGQSIFQQLFEGAPDTIFHRFG